MWKCMAPMGALKENYTGHKTAIEDPYFVSFHCKKKGWMCLYSVGLDVVLMWLVVVLVRPCYPEYLSVGKTVRRSRSTSVLNVTLSGSDAGKVENWGFTTSRLISRLLTSVITWSSVFALWAGMTLREWLIPSVNTAEGGHTPISSTCQSHTHNMTVNYDTISKAETSQPAISTLVIPLKHGLYTYTIYKYVDTQDLHVSGSLSCVDIRSDKFFHRHKLWRALFELLSCRQTHKVIIGILIINEWKAEAVKSGDRTFSTGFVNQMQKKQTIIQTITSYLQHYKFTPLQPTTTYYKQNQLKAARGCPFTFGHIFVSLSFVLLNHFSQ